MTAAREYRSPYGEIMKQVNVSLFVAVLAVGGAGGLAACGSSSGNDGAPSTSAAEGPITVEQLIARSADTAIAVTGLLHTTDGVTRLCDKVLESYPVQCGEPSVELVGLDPGSIQGTTTAGDVTWKEGVILDLRRAADGRFDVVDVEADLTIDVVLGLYSGVPDPTWTLTAEQANELSATLATLTSTTSPTPPGGLGYHGFTIVSSDGTLVAFDGKVADRDASPPYVLDDPDRSIERFLLDTAQPHVEAVEFSEVQQALGQT